MTYNMNVPSVKNIGNTLYYKIVSLAGGDGRALSVDRG
jgi:hypothetical protein